MATRKRNYYREARFEEKEGHPLDDEIDRRLRHATLSKQIHAAQDRLMAALGEQGHLFLRLEELFGNRAMDREEAMFNLGFEHGLVLGRADTLAASLQEQGARGRALARRLIQLAASAGLEPSRALAVLLEVAWGLALGPRKPPVAPRSRRTK